MGTMNKLREHTGVILWILVISFGIIWVLQDSGAFDVVGNMAGTNIIVVDGDVITYDEYSRALDAQLQQYQTRTGESMPPQMVDLEKERVFNGLVEDRLMKHEMDRLGIKVTDEEVIEMVMGPNPHPIITTYFSDGKGGINRTLLQNFVDDPEARDEWIQLEDYLRTERRRAKLQALVAASVHVSNEDVLAEYNKRNLSVNAEYVALRYSEIPDDQVKVSDDDLRAFYNENKEDFKREKTFTVNYVSMSKDPTAEDTSLVVTELQKLRERFATTDNDSLFLARNGSEKPYSSAYTGADELEPSVAEAVFANLTPGAIVGPIVGGNEAHLIKIGGTRPADEPLIKARHILFSAPEGNAAQRAEAVKTAQDVKQRLQGGQDFAALARQYSDDPGSAAQGGNLGFFGKGRMVAPFEEAAFGAATGAIVGPVETQYGYHLIQVTGRATQEVQLADYVLQIRPNVGTLTAIEEKLDDLQYYATESGDFKAEAGRRQLAVKTVEVEDKQQFIPELGNSRALMNFVTESDKGDVSKVIELNNQFIVAQLENVTPAGYRPFDEVKDELVPRTRIKKKAEIQKEKLEAALKKSGFNGLAAAVGSTVRMAPNVTFNNPVVPGLGRDIKFTGTALGLKQNQVSDVVEGENAAYVVRVSAITAPANITDAQREEIKNELLSQRRSTVMNRWLSSLREKAEIEDNRRHFQQ